ncbi:MAG TPA: LuxR C-terminal-related transcriptional regulator [Propionibacteriaceae bacterium]|nr:LuxR C-terminal-related transcriptional regulator [Propionibacteriaceae bacterium]
MTGNAMAESRTSSSDEAATEERAELLATKLNIPQPRLDQLRRSRLIDRLNQGMGQKLIMVCTPAGFGKTNLLADWAACTHWPVAWLSLDPHDNDPVRFWRYVVGALDRACGGLAEHVLPHLTPSSVIGGEVVATALSSGLQAAPQTLALVLDDYHLIESRPIHEGMAYLLDHLPPRLRPVISSRSDPPLPLARLRGRAQLAELQTTDLRFNPDETTALLRDAWGLDLTPHAIAALEARTEGWGVGLQLAALSLRERADPDTLLTELAGTHRYILDYLSEEVLERQPERVQAFLLQTSILDRLCGPLCDAVTGDADGQDMLERLERSNLFLVALDDERHWWRFHQLFRDLLRARLRRTAAVRVSELHRRAGAWCAQHGLIDEAIQHAVASGDAIWAVQLVEEHVHEILGRGESVILERWLSVLPVDVVQSRPALSFAQGEMQFHIGHLDGTEHFLKQAERAIDDQPHRGFAVPTHAGMVAELPAAIALLRAELAGARGDPEEMATYAREALGRLAEDERGPRFWARWLSGAGADWMRGRVADAEPIAAEMLAEGRATADPYPLITSCYALAAVQQARGKLDAALRTYRDGLRFATQGSRLSPFHAAEAHLGIAQVLYEQDHLDDALQHVTEGIELGRQLVWFFEPGRRLVTLAWIRQASGDPDGAMDAMNEAYRMHPSPEVNSRWNPAPVERARLLLVQGHIGKVERWIEDRRLTVEDEVSYVREPEHLLLARLLLAKSDPRRALGLLQSLDDLAESQDRKESLILIKALRSIALQASGNHTDALAVLADALALARPSGYVRVFADEGPPMAALLKSLIRTRQPNRAALASDAAREHLNRLIRAFRTPIGRPEVGERAASGMVEPLTERELEVLGLIAAGRPNREIADQLVVTLETVKKHTSHIFSKLGAASRIQAVSKARELGLIS